MGLRQKSNIYGEHAPWWGEYVAQYREAAKFSRGANALDIGCGEGYGSRYLFDGGAVEVLGMDKDEALISRARERYGRDGVEFLSKRIEDVENPKPEFDLITSFQVLEKSMNPDHFIHNIYKSLKPTGLALISTVNRTRYSKLTEAPADASHVAEFDISEFNTILKRYFSNIQIQAMNCSRGNTIAEKIVQRVLGSQFYPRPEDYFLEESISSQTPLFYAFCKKN